LARSREVKNALPVPGLHRGLHAMHFSGIGGTPAPPNNAVSAQLRKLKWARLDSNQGPRDYESPALTS
jgi:hypothetical protein